MDLAREEETGQTAARRRGLHARGAPFRAGPAALGRTSREGGENRGKRTQGDGKRMNEQPGEAHPVNQKILDQTATKA
jgi:hypothetical protein